MKKLLVSLALVCLFSTIARSNEQQVVDRCTLIAKEFRNMPEQKIPAEIWREAKGIAILSVVKAAFIFSGKIGQGVVLARTEHGWSGPSFISTGGAGWGFQAGAEVIDYVFVLNDTGAIHAFSMKGNVQLGGDVSIAAGPMGRTAAAGVTRAAAIYSYSRAKGLFGGVSLEGAILATQSGANSRYYGQPIRARQILYGDVDPPPGARELRKALR